MKMMLRNIRRVALVAGALTGVGGCYKATFYRDPSVVKGEEHDRWTAFFIFGLVGTEVVDVHEFCPSGQVAQVQTGGNFGTGLIGALTLGIYTPHKVYVTCESGAPRGGRGLTLEIDADRAGRPVAAKWHDGERSGTAHLAQGSNQIWRVSNETEAMR